MTGELAFPAPAVARVGSDYGGLGRDLGELRGLLGETIVRHEGRGLLELVEQVLELIDSDHEAADLRLARLEPALACRLVQRLRRLLPPRQRHRAGPSQS
jgi:phosphoenolpyruvate carboxylase